MTDLTAFQRMVPDDEAEAMLNDLRNADDLTPEGETMDSVDGLQLSLTFRSDDLPQMIEELEEITDG
jgi:hypothetical protein